MERALQRIFRVGFETYSQGRRLPRHYHTNAYWIQHCRTARLGGHAEYCENGHLHRVQYNSCHTRSCPQCNGLVRERWLERQKERLLRCGHRHIIFTIDHGLNPLWRCNRREMADVLFRAAAETLKTFTQDPRYLGGTPGVLLGLHTWTRTLGLHPHIHALVSEGGLDARGQWCAAKRDFFLPARAVMAMFRGKMLDFVRRGVVEDRLRLPAGVRRQQMLNRLNRMGRKKWNVRIEQRYAHGAGVATYLARYLRGGPVRDRQLSLEGRTVSFRPRVRSGAERLPVMRMPAEAFVARVLQHLPEPQRPTIRRVGLYTPCKQSALNRARGHLLQRPVVEDTPRLDVQEYCRRVFGQPPSRVCATCGAPVDLARRVPRAHDPPPLL
ncbi:MAG: transposase [Arenicellales bacterium]